MKGGGEREGVKNSYRTIMENRKKIHRAGFLLTREKTDAEKHKWRYKNIANRIFQTKNLTFRMAFVEICLHFIRSVLTLENASF